MAMSGSISLSGSTITVGQSITATLTVTNSGASAIKMTSIIPYSYFTGGSLNKPFPCSFSVVALSPGNTISVPGSGTQTFLFKVIPHITSGVGTLSIGAYCISSDGSTFQATEGTMSSNEISQYMKPSVHKSTVSVGLGSVVHGGNTTTITVTLKDTSGTQLPYGGHKVSLRMVGGTSTGTIGAVTDNTNGTYTATFTSGTAGTAMTIVGLIDGATILTSLPTITVT